MVIGLSLIHILYSSIAVGALLILCTVVFLHPLLKMLGATESILPYAEEYTRIYVVFSIFNVFNVTMNNLVTSEGAAKTTMFTPVSYTHLDVYKRQR